MRAPQARGAPVRVHTAPALTSWLAISFQLGEVNALVSVAHRMALAAVLCAALTWLRRAFVPLAAADHARIFLQGLCLFSCNYLFIYCGDG
jgi:hypothetical protein